MVRDVFLAGYTASALVDLDDIFLNDDEYARQYAERVISAGRVPPVELAA